MDENIMNINEYDKESDNIDILSVVDDIDAIEEMLHNFKKENTDINALIKDLNSELINNMSLVDISKDIENLTARVTKLDQNVDVIKDSIRLFNEMYGAVTEFTTNIPTIINMITKTKNDLKGLKQLQVANYHGKIELINQKIAKLKSYRDIGIEESASILIDSLKYLDKIEFEVTDWKYNKHKNINYKEIDELINTIDMIEEQLNINKTSEYIEKIEGLKDNLSKKVDEVNELINDSMSPNDIVIANQKLRDIANLIYNFGTELYQYKDKISDTKHKEYIQFSRKIRNKYYFVNNKLITNKVYKNIKDELTSQLNEISQRLNVFLRYVDIHYGNANKDIVDFDRTELFLLEKDFKYIDSKIELRKEQLIGSQYKSLKNISNTIESRISEAKEKIYDENMIRKTELYSQFIEEIETAIQELEDYFNELNGPINISNNKEISNKINYIKDKIENFDSILKNNRNHDSKEYDTTTRSILGFKERISKISSDYESKKPLRVKMIKSGEKIYKEHSKLILTSAGIITITLILRKFLLIPAIMHGNIMIGSISPTLQSTTNFFNKILGSMVGASMDLNGVWHLANGLAINSTVATTSLLKSLVAGMSGLATATVPMLILSVKELVKEMKIKEHIMNLKNKMKKEEKNNEEQVFVEKDQIFVEEEQNTVGRSK